MSFNDFKALCVYRSRYVNILTRNTSVRLDNLEVVQEPKFALNHRECEIILKIKSPEIEILKVQGDIEYKTLNVEYFQLNNLKPFRNLKKLIFQRTAVTDEELDWMGQNCLHLRSLHLIECFCEDFQDLVIGVNISVDSICKIRQLQELVIQATNSPGIEREIKLKFIQQLLNSLMKLKKLDLNNFTIVCKDSEKTNRLYMPLNYWPLEVLNVGIITFEFWCTFTGYLKCCPQLRQLTINGNKDTRAIIEVKVIDILSKYCTNLKILKLENCDINVDDFCPLQGLQELTLNSCHGLTFNNLQQILGGLKLNTFKLINTRVFDHNNYIYVSHTLESLTIDTINFTEISEMFQRSLNNFTGLRSLNWCNGDLNHNWIIDKCPQLQQLNITNPYHLSRIVLNMKSLTELTLTSCNGISWSLLKKLIFSMSLKSLKIYSDNVIIGDDHNSQNSFKMHTTLELLTIPHKIFRMTLKYWLDLLDVNEQLRLFIYGKADDILNVRLVCLLLAVECVRKRWKHIKICGFNLELENFKNNTILREIARMHINTNHYKSSKIPFTLEL